VRGVSLGHKTQIVGGVTIPIVNHAAAIAGPFTVFESQTSVDMLAAKTRLVEANQRPDAESAASMCSLAAASLPKGSSVTACGAVSSGLRLSAKVKLTVVKQESTHGTFVHV
jgi:hypothetical protein